MCPALRSRDVNCGAQIARLVHWGEFNMFDWLLPENHAIAILKRDHDTVKGLFDEYERTEVNAAGTIIEKALIELKIHAVIEEEIFYPTVRKYVGADLMNEADEEHHVARLLIAELDSHPAAETIATPSSGCWPKVCAITSKRKRRRCCRRRKRWILTSSSSGCVYSPAGTN